MADLWYYASNNQQQGPVTHAELEQLAQANDLKPNDLVWRDGMIDWVKAATIPGLFGGDAGDPVMDLDRPRRRDDDAEPRRRSRYDIEEARRRPRYFDEDVDEPGRSRRKRSSSGLKVAFIFAGLFVFVIVAILAIWLAFAASVDKGPVNASYSASLGVGETSNRNFHFRAGALIEFKVHSEQQSDVDIKVYNDAGNEVTADLTEGPDSFCLLKVPRTGWYLVEVQNLGPTPAFPFAGINRSHMTVRDVTPAPAPAPKKQGQPKS